MISNCLLNYIAFTCHKMSQCLAKKIILWCFSVTFLMQQKSSCYISLSVSIGRWHCYIINGHQNKHTCHEVTEIKQNNSWRGITFSVVNRTLIKLKIQLPKILKSELKSYKNNTYKKKSTTEMKPEVKLNNVFGVFGNS